jgi:hypothetical protein
MLHDYNLLQTRLIVVGAKINLESDRIVSMEEAYAFTKECGAVGYPEVSEQKEVIVHEIIDQIGAFCIPHLSRWKLQRCGQLQRRSLLHLLP